MHFNHLILHALRAVKPLTLLLLAFLCLPLMAGATEEATLTASHIVWDATKAGTLPTPKLVLPDGYTGKPTYSLKVGKNTTIDANGVATFSNASLKSAYMETVTISLPAQGSYAAQTLTYRIFYYNSDCRWDIYSKDDWKKMAKSSDEYKVVFLHTDLEMGNSDYVNWFQGLFDGQGHTFHETYVEQTSHYYSAPFYKISGTAFFKNINITGTATITRPYNDMAGLINIVKSDGTYVCIENCHSSLAFDDSYGDNSNKFSGFINRLEDKSEVVFRDCSFGAHLSCVDNSWMVGYISKLDEDITGVSFINCFSDLQDSWNGDNYYSAYLSYYIGVGHKGGEKCTAINSYAREYGRAEGKDRVKGLTLVTGRQLKSGEVTFKLNAGRTGDEAVWLQTIDTDTVPKLRLTSPKSKEVLNTYSIVFNLPKEGWSTLFYPYEATLPETTKKYVVTSVDETTKTVKLSELTSKHIANIPLVLYSEKAYSGSYSHSAVYFNMPDQSGYLRGVGRDVTPSGNYYTVSGRTDEQTGTSAWTFSKGTGDVGQWQCYIAGGTADAYTLEVCDEAEDDVYVISSKDDWTTFAENHSGKKANVYLTNDITLGAGDASVEKFLGTFNGMGHTVTFDYDYATAGGATAPNELFQQAEGTIKNLRLSGKYVTNDFGVYFPAIVNAVKGEEGRLSSITFENCHNDVDYDVSASSAKYISEAAAFVHSASYAQMTFSDCSFTGRAKGGQWSSGGGFVGSIADACNVTVNNSYSNTTRWDFTNSTSNACGPFLGYVQSKDKLNCTLENCYYAWPSSVTANHTTGAALVTTDQLKSGEVAFRLKNSRTGDEAVWGQTLGTDDTPLSLTFSPESKEVFHAKRTIPADTETHWTTLYYPVGLDISGHEGIDLYDDCATDGDGNLLIYENLSGKLAANTPALLYAAGGFTTAIELPEAYYNKAEQSGGNGLIVGTETSIDAGELFTLIEDEDESTTMFAQTGTGTTLPAWQCYATKGFSLVQDGAIITSKDDWNTFRTKYNDKEQGYARLATDLTLTDDDEPMESFRGVFDGQGHTITVNYTKGYDGQEFAPFRTARGSTIRNLNLDGTITASGNTDVYSSPLVSYVAGGTSEQSDELTIKNCHSSVKFVGSEGSFILQAGGFVRYVNPYATVSFTDCSFTGGFETTGQITTSGGFVGYVKNSGSNITLNFTNCFSAPTDCAIGSTDTRYPLGYFCGGTTSKLAYNVTNCYAQKTANFVNKDSKIDLLDAEAVAQGAAAYALNAGRSGTAALWGQTIGTDAVPQLKTFSPESEEVYKAEGTATVGTAGWGTLYYPEAVTLADGIKAYTVSSVEEQGSEHVLVLTATENPVPAATPVLLSTLDEGEKSAVEAHTVTLPVYYYNSLGEQNIDWATGLFLVGVQEDLPSPDGCYVLQNHNGNTAFYRVDVAAGQPVIPAWKCYLYWKTTDTGDTDAGSVRLRFDGSTTGIGAAATLPAILTDGPAYDLSGHRVNSLQNGTPYVKNGKKFIVK